MPGPSRLLWNCCLKIFSAAFGPLATSDTKLVIGSMHCEINTRDWLISRKFRPGCHGINVAGSFRLSVPEHQRAWFQSTLSLFYNTDVQFHNAGGLLVCDFTINFCARRLLSAFKSGSWIAEIFCVPYLQILWTGDWTDIYGVSGYWAAQSGPEECSQCFLYFCQVLHSSRGEPCNLLVIGVALPRRLCWRRLVGWSIFWKSILSKLVLGAKQLCYIPQGPSGAKAATGDQRNVPEIKRVAILETFQIQGCYHGYHVLRTFEKMQRLPLNDLFGERIRYGSQKLGNHLWQLYSACPRAANLTDDEMRYLVEILGAMPNATVVSSDVLNVNMMPRDANWR